MWHGKERLEGLVPDTYLILLCLLLRRISAEGVDIVLDCLCGDNTGKGLSLLKPLGTYILYGECTHSGLRSTGSRKHPTVLNILGNGKTWECLDFFSPFIMLLLLS